MKSAAVELHVVAKLGDLSIEILGTAVLSSPVDFNAMHFKGDSLRYTWDFGDGTQKITTESSKVSHKYSR